MDVVEREDGEAGAREKLVSMADGRQQDKTYLGDGVYAGHDGFQIWLSVEGGGDEPNYIALEPLMLLALIAYAKKLGMIPRG